MDVAVDAVTIGGNTVTRHREQIGEMESGQVGVGELDVEQANHSGEDQHAREPQVRSETGKIRSLLTLGHPSSLELEL